MRKNEEFIEDDPLGEHDVFDNNDDEDIDTFSQELHPCPFCGNSDIKMVVEGNIYFHYCDDCGTEVTESYDEESAIRWWNTRPVEDKLRKQLTIALSTLKKIRGDVYPNGIPTAILANQAIEEIKKEDNND
jgi:Lar family restriction alleviation protein